MARDEGGATGARLRSVAPTLPGMLTGGEVASGTARRLEWCVEVGDEVVLMSTLEAWLGIANGLIVRRQRVWRDGMDRWAPAESVDELRCAFWQDPSAALPWVPADGGQHGSEQAELAWRDPAHDTDPMPPPDRDTVVPPRRPREAMWPAAALADPTDRSAMPAAPARSEAPVRTRSTRVGSAGVAVASLAGVVAVIAGVSASEGSAIARAGAGPVEPAEQSAARVESSAAIEVPPGSGVRSQGRRSRAPAPAGSEPGQRRLRHGSR